jgi:hypothetical protein
LLTLAFGCRQALRPSTRTAGIQHGRSRPGSACAGQVSLMISLYAACECRNILQIAKTRTDGQAGIEFFFFHINDLRKRSKLAQFLLDIPLATTIVCVVAPTTGREDMNKWKLSASASLLAAALLSPTMGQATVIGSAYLNNAAASSAVIGFSHGAADVTFSVPSPTNSACTGIFAGDTLCFNSNAQSNGYTLGGFLATGGATVLTGSAAALASNLNNTVFEFTGTVTVTNGEQFQAGHDDGLQLMIGSTLVINAPGPTGFTTTPATYTGPSGTFTFDLVYGECCGAPALLGISLPLVTGPPSIPEPATLALSAAGLLVLGVIRRKRG